MKALILAAGEGKRIKVIGDSKPLVSLLGLGLIERGSLTAKKAGIKPTTFSRRKRLLSFIPRRNRAPVQMV